MSTPNTHYGAEKIGAMMQPPKKLFFAGIGGVSMCTLAHISLLRGYTVCGYDRTKTALTEQLEALGIQVWYENDTAHLDGVDMLIYTVAIPDTLPEYAEAVRKNIPTVSRADYLGYLMTGYETRIGVCGTHGKSTTTAMLARLFRMADRNPTVSCGAPMKDADGRCDIIGSNRDFIFEACEYMDSFLDFYPTEVVSMNLELDHLDYFHSLAEIERSFGKFMDKTGSAGTAYINHRDKNLAVAAENYHGKIVTFGISDHEADYCADEITYTHGCASFTVFRKNSPLCKISLSVPGEHNITDALAAASVALTHGIAPETVAKALGSFTGASRRMDYKGKTASGAEVYDDYAHHPTEILSSIKAAAGIAPKRLFVAFQSHTYTRTKELFDDFATVLANPAVNGVFVAEIYPARETDTLGMSAKVLADGINAKGGHAAPYPTFAAIADAIKATCTEGDIVLVMGAGDVYKICNMILQ